MARWSCCDECFLRSFSICLACGNEFEDELKLNLEDRRFGWFPPPRGLGWPRPPPYPPPKRLLAKQLQSKNIRWLPPPPPYPEKLQGRGRRSPSVISSSSRRRRKCNKAMHPSHSTRRRQRSPAASQPRPTKRGEPKVKTKSKEKKL